MMFTEFQKETIKNALKYQNGWLTDEIKEAISRIIEKSILTGDEPKNLTGWVLDTAYPRDKITGQYKKSFLAMVGIKNEVSRLLERNGYRCSLCKRAGWFAGSYCEVCTEKMTDK